MIQFASPYTGDDREENSLDNWMGKILEKHPDTAPKWEASETFGEEDTISQQNGTGAKSRLSTNGSHSRRQTRAKPAPVVKPKPKEEAVPDGIDLNNIKRDLQIMGGWSDDMVNALPPADLVSTAKALGLIPEKEETVHE